MALSQETVEDIAYWMQKTAEFRTRYLGPIERDVHAVVSSEASATGAGAVMKVV
jgi:hypothetical protein